MRDYNDPIEHRDADPLAPVAVQMLRVALSLLRDVDPGMPIQRALLFATVAADGGQTVGYYSQATGLPLQTTSRGLIDLADGSRSIKRPVGPGLLERLDGGGSNAREVAYRLSPKGRQLLREAVQRVARIT